MDHLIYSVEDDENIRFIISKSLSNYGYIVRTFDDGISVLEALNDKKPDILMLDIMLPGLSGIDILKRIRSDKKYKDIYIIMVSARGEELDKVSCFDNGADDYITKPFGVLELVSKINAIIRRRFENNVIITCQDVAINVNERSCYKGDTPIILTAKEFDLLKYLVERKNTVVTKEDLLTDVWGYNYVSDTRTVDTHIKCLRHKLAQNQNEQLIVNIHGVGYKIVES